jgi:hypothetical protein
LGETIASGFPSMPSGKRGGVSLGMINITKTIKSVEKTLREDTSISPQVQTLLNRRVAGM